ncbi:MULTISPECIES: hypothetical protein [Halomonas]|uniref:Mu-like prophage FluMu N-terminal domain-containing protein n=1 Tax=Halomonas halophila TaxID=29573 RepID=A0ABQ0TZB7_9GAMM|nr:MULTISPECIES: hypothetical protein [Halomonas]MDR5889637.1 hypothetical protein [Halomonas salina]WJY06319.1 hypothetical protein QWG60_11435 [Halomonas halophila]GEK71594.1 hypothetical protein HHA04nite_01380 [Halomonas halophila]
MATAKTTTRKTSKAAQEKPRAAEEQAQAKPADATQPNADDSLQTPEAGRGEASEPQGAVPEAKEAKANAKPREGGEIPAVFVRTRKRYGSRRRAGFRFTQEGLGIALSALSDEQLEALHADPALEVEECTFPAEEDGEPEA